MSESSSGIVRIAIDAMGGDFAPSNEIHGAMLAYKQMQNINLEIVFVGNETQIRSVLSGIDNGDIRYSIVHSEDVITMDDDPTAAIKSKKNSSLVKGLELLAQGYVDAFISAGNTGATFSASTVILGRIKGVSRPTIGAFFPTISKYPTLLLDVGANIDCKAKYIYEFAVMGSIYTREMLGLEHPRVAVLNIGEEASKGTEVVQSTYEMIKGSQLNFIGNVEGSDILLGSADVVVCDGFVGNIIMKFAESFIVVFKSSIKKFASKSVYNKLLLLFMAPVFKKIFKDFDYQEYGGVPILGVNGIVIIGHGKSSPKAISSMIRNAIDMKKKELNKKIENMLNQSLITEPNKQ
jgi:glycerol-3-phosphate acyltransferase PlsX